MFRSLSVTKVLIRPNVLAIINRDLRLVDLLFRLWSLFEIISYHQGLFHKHSHCYYQVAKKGRDLTTTPTHTENPLNKLDNTKTSPKTSITQQLRTDLGRSVEDTKRFCHVVKVVL